jgi:hypothetical protein
VGVRSLYSGGTTNLVAPVSITDAAQRVKGFASASVDVCSQARQSLGELPRTGQRGYKKTPGHPSLKGGARGN